MTREEEFAVFIAGWKAAFNKISAEIKSYSDPWLPNGPSFATARAILQQIDNIPLPKSEDTIDVRQ